MPSSPKTQADCVVAHSALRQLDSMLSNLVPRSERGDKLRTMKASVVFELWRVERQFAEGLI